MSVDGSVKNVPRLKGIDVALDEIEHTSMRASLQYVLRSLAA